MVFRFFHVAYDAAGINNNALIWQPSPLEGTSVFVPMSTSRFCLDFFIPIDRQLDYKRGCLRKTLSNMKNLKYGV